MSVCHPHRCRCLSRSVCVCMWGIDTNTFIDRANKNPSQLLWLISFFCCDKKKGVFVTYLWPWREIISKVISPKWKMSKWINASTVPQMTTKIVEACVYKCVQWTFTRRACCFKAEQPWRKKPWSLFKSTSLMFRSQRQDKASLKIYRDVDVK